MCPVTCRALLLAILSSTCLAPSRPEWLDPESSEPVCCHLVEAESELLPTPADSDLQAGFLREAKSRCYSTRKGLGWPRLVLLQGPTVQEGEL